MCSPARFLLVVFGGSWVRQIPMAALVAVRVMVPVGASGWASLRKLRTYPKSSSAVVLGAINLSAATHDLAKGVF